MIISSDIENLFYKIQHRFMKKEKKKKNNIKQFQEYKLGIELVIERNFLNMMLNVVRTKLPP